MLLAALSDLPTLQQLIPDVEIILALSPEELPPYLLEQLLTQDIDAQNTVNPRF
jgi:hypothetical protein